MRLEQILTESIESVTPLIDHTVVKQKLYFCEENVNMSTQTIIQ